MPRCAFAIVLLSAAAQADVPADQTTTATISVGPTYHEGLWESPDAPDSDWYRVQLTAGVDYAINFWAPYENGAPQAEVRLRSPSGAVLMTSRAGSVGVDGFEHRPQVSGTHFIEAAVVGKDYKDDFYGHYQLAVMTDCRGDQISKCRVNLGYPKTGRISFLRDADAYRLWLSSNSRYNATLTSKYHEQGGSDCHLKVLNQQGAALVDITAYEQVVLKSWRPPFSSYYYMSARCVYNTDYPGERFELLVRRP